MKIFMIGTQRSGSNLFRLMLNQLPEIAAPHPPHILTRMMPLVESYGDLENPETFALLVDDACRLVEANPVEWEGVELDRADIARRCDRHDLYAVMAAIYDTLRDKWGKTSWCCKSLGNVKYADQLADRFPDAKFIYLYRDGRDVALSFTKAVEGEKHYYNIAKDWDAGQQQAIRLRERVGDDRVISISYEDLTGDEQGTMRRVCTFLGVPYSADTTEFYKTDEAKRAADASNLWENVTKPVMKDNTRKFLKATSPEDLAIFESVAGRSLRRPRLRSGCGEEGRRDDLHARPDRRVQRRERAPERRSGRSSTKTTRRRREEQKSVLDAIVARNAARRNSPATVGA